MKLGAYLESQNMQPQAFAARIGVSGEAVRLWINGARTPRAEHLKAIREATNGAVTPNDFLSDEKRSDGANAADSPFTEAAQ